MKQTSKGLESATFKKRLEEIIEKYFPKLGTSYDMQHVELSNDVISLLEESIDEWMPKERKQFHEIRKGDNLQKSAYDQNKGFNEALSQTEENFRKWLKGEK